MRYYLIAALFVIFLIGPKVYGDTWLYENKSTDSVYEYGNTKIVKTLDATKNQKSPEFILRIYYRNELSAQYKNVSFENLFASPDNNLFIGLSNGGIPGTAIVVFGKEGELNLEIKHNLGHLVYCEESVTVRRVWYDAENPEVEFKMDASGGKIEDIMLRDCSGKTVSLFDIVEQAYNKPIKPTP